MPAPYPSYPPNLSVVSKTGGFYRTCVVLDLYTIEPITPAQLSQIEDQIGLTVSKMKTIHSSDVVGPNRFTTQLLNALRLE